MATRTKLKYIESTNEQFKDLGVEVLELHNNIKKNKERLDIIGDGSNNDSCEVEHNIINEKVDVNKTNIEIINTKLEGIENNHLHIIPETISINKSYEYDSDGKVVKEISSGDILQVKEYVYNNLGNISEEIIFENNVEVGKKTYIYDKDQNVVQVVSINADKTNIAVMDYAISDITSRLKRIEGLDVVEIADILNKDVIQDLINKINDMSIKIGILENLLPENITSLIDIPEILNRLTDVENTLDRGYMSYKFEVDSELSRYRLPEGISSNVAIYMEGLLLENGGDYVIREDVSEIEFLIPLIDGFEIQCKY